MYQDAFYRISREVPEIQDVFQAQLIAGSAVDEILIGSQDFHDAGSDGAVAQYCNLYHWSSPYSLASIFK